MFSRNFWKFFGVFLAIMLVAGGGFFVWDRYFSEQAKGVRAFQDYQKRVEEAYRNDTYGGKTPEETLKLFVEALKKEDIELASKYFALDDNLSREYASLALREAQKKGSLQNMANLLSNARPYEKDRLYKNDFKYTVYDGEVLRSEIDMEFNPASKIWKIESL